MKTFLATTHLSDQHVLNEYKCAHLHVNVHVGLHAVFIFKAECPQELSIVFLLPAVFGEKDFWDWTWPEGMRLLCPLKNWELPVYFPVYISYICLTKARTVHYRILKMQDCMFNSRKLNSRHGKMHRHDTNSRKSISTHCMCWWASEMASVNIVELLTPCR